MSRVSKQSLGVVTKDKKELRYRWSDIYLYCLAEPFLCGRQVPAVHGEHTKVEVDPLIARPRRHDPLEPSQRSLSQPGVTSLLRGNSEVAEARMRACYCGTCISMAELRSA